MQFQNVTNSALAVINIQKYRVLTLAPPLMIIKMHALKCAAKQNNTMIILMQLKFQTYRSNPLWSYKPSYLGCCLFS